jgi:hypothetical protein
MWAADSSLADRDTSHTTINLKEEVHYELKFKSLSKSRLTTQFCPSDTLPWANFTL